MGLIPILHVDTALCRFFSETRSLHIHKNIKIILGLNTVRGPGVENGCSETN